MEIRIGDQDWRYEEGQRGQHGTGWDRTNFYGCLYLTDAGKIKYVILRPAIEFRRERAREARGKKKTFFNTEKRNEKKVSRCRGYFGLKKKLKGVRPSAPALALALAFAFALALVSPWE